MGKVVGMIGVSMKVVMGECITTPWGGMITRVTSQSPGPHGFIEPLDMELNTLRFFRCEHEERCIDFAASPRLDPDSKRFSFTGTEYPDFDSPEAQWEGFSCLNCSCHEPPVYREGVADLEIRRHLLENVMTSRRKG